MKILINGNSLSEILRSRMRENKFEQCEIALNHIKKNKKTYKMLVMIIATVLFSSNPIIGLAIDVAHIESKIQPFADSFLKLIIMLGKYCAIGKAGYDGIAMLLEGATLKEIIGGTAKPVIVYVWLQFLPELVSSFSF